MEHLRKLINQKQKKAPKNQEKNKYNRKELFKILLKLKKLNKDKKKVKKFLNLQLEKKSVLYLNKN